MRLFLLLITLAFWSGTVPASAQDTPPVARATLYFDGVPLFDMRGIAALPARERVRLARSRIKEAADDPAISPAAIVLTEVSDGYRIGTPEQALVNVFNEDAELEDIDTRVLAETVRLRLTSAIADYRLARQPEGIGIAVGQAALWTAGFAAVLLLLALMGRATSRLINAYVAQRIGRWERRAWNVVQLRAIWSAVRAGLRAFLVVLGIVAAYFWLNGVLLALPWTRDAGREALALATNPIISLFRGALDLIPNLIALVVIVFLTIGLLRIQDRFFAMIASGHVRLGRFEKEWAAPTERLVRIAIVLFGVVVAYPYIPGSSTQAFKAVGIFTGLILSLGASSFVANLVAGHALIYRRAFRVGDRISVGDTIGDVLELTGQATYLRTLKNELVTIPNAIVLGSQVKNFTRFAGERGLILHTEVGIGYEVPWQEVEAMLLEAAKRTRAVLPDPPPFVLQTRLGDFAPTYELNAYTADEKAMPATYSALHANIQDVFAERGVQIMTPNYVGDPVDAKVPPVEAAMAKPT